MFSVLNDVYNLQVTMLSIVMNKLLIHWTHKYD